MAWQRPLDPSNKQTPTELWARTRHSLAPRLTLPTAFLVCLGGGFVLQPSPVWALTFYLGVVPLTIRQLWRGATFPWRNPYALLAFALILWSALTLAWGENAGGGRTTKFLWDTACTTVFFVSALLVLEDDALNRRRLGTVLIVAGAFNALVSIGFFLWSSPVGSRLVGWAETRHSILGASVIGVCYVFALARCVAGRAHRTLNGIAAALFFAFIAMTQSRGPLIAALAASLVFVVGRSRRQQAYFFAVLALMAVVVVLVPGLQRQLLDSFVERGDSHRLEIWAYTLSEVAKRPWFGHGLAANLHLSPAFTFPHSLYLSTLFYSGILGFLLLMALLVALTLGLLRRRDVPERQMLVALWVNALLSGLTDLGQVTKGPDPIWYIIWLPIALNMVSLTSPSASGPPPHRLLDTSNARLDPGRSS